MNGTLWNKLPADVTMDVFKLLPVRKRAEIRRVCKSWNNYLKEQDGRLKDRFDKKLGVNTFELRKSECFRNECIQDFFDRLRNRLHSPLARPCCAKVGDVVTLWENIDDQFRKGDRAFVNKVIGDELEVMHVSKEATRIIPKCNFVYGVPAHTIQAKLSDILDAVGLDILDHLAPGVVIGLRKDLNLPGFHFSAGASLKYLGNMDSFIYKKEGMALIENPANFFNGREQSYIRRAKQICQARNCNMSSIIKEHGQAAFIAINRPERPR